MLARSSVRKPHSETIGPLLKLQLRVTAYQNHGPNVFVANGRCERVNHGFAISRPAQPNRVEYIPFGRETKVFGCIARRLRIVKRSGRYLGWTFTVPQM
jgi:hypothetical protein